MDVRPGPPPHTCCIDVDLPSQLRLPLHSGRLAQRIRIDQMLSIPASIEARKHVAKMETL
jgi:hypothetical protein